MEDAQKTELFESMPIPRAVMKLAIPTVLSSLVMVLYNLADTYFVGMLNNAVENAAVTLAAPLLLAFNAVNNLFGVGSSSMMSRSLGKKDYETVYRSAAFGFYCSIFAGLLFSIAYTVFQVPLLNLLGATEETLGATIGYARWTVTFGAVPAILNVVLAYLVRAEGAAMHASIGTMSGCFLNIILDPIFIFVLKLEVAGAALATVISQMASCAFVLCSLLREKMPVPLRWGGFDRKIMMRIVTFGLSPFLIIATDSVLLIVLNTVLQHYGGPELGDKLVTCATIVQSYLLLITMPMGGLTLGTQPVISFNYGAGNVARIKRAMKSIVGLCLAFCGLMTVVTYTLSPVFVRLFTQSPELIDRSVGYIKVFTAMILPLAIQYPLVDETTALGHVRLALFCSLFRKTVFLACLLLLPALVSAEATFLSEPIADAVAATVTTILFLQFFPRILAERSGSPAAQ